MKKFKTENGRIVILYSVQDVFDIACKKGLTIRTIMTPPTINLDAASVVWVLDAAGFSFTRPAVAEEYSHEFPLVAVIDGCLCVERLDSDLQATLFAEVSKERKILTDNIVFRGNEMLFCRAKGKHTS